MARYAMTSALMGMMKMPTSAMSRSTFVMVTSDGAT